MKEILIRLVLKGEEVERFLTLKKIKGVQANTELLRVLISEEYQRVRGMIK